MRIVLRPATDRRWTFCGQPIAFGGVGVAQAIEAGPAAGVDGADVGPGPCGHRLLDRGVRSLLRSAGLLPLGEGLPKPGSAADCGAGAIAGSRVGLAGHVSRRVGNNGAVPSWGLRDAVRHGGAAAQRWPAAPTDPRPSREPGLPRRSGRGGIGPAALRRASRGERLKVPLIDPRLHDPSCRPFQAKRAFNARGRTARLGLRAEHCPRSPRAARRQGLRPPIRHMIRTVARLVHSGAALAVGLRQLRLPPRPAALRRLATHWT